MKQDFKVLPGTPYPMGISETADGGINFAAALYTKEECGVKLYPRDGGRAVKLPFTDENKVGNIYCMKVPELDISRYEYNFYTGEEELTDPYAKLLFGNERWGGQAEPKLRGGFNCRHFDWGDDRPLLTPLSESILYLLHVRGFTRHNSSGVTNKGTFAGIVEKIPYLKDLGITSVELMPAYEFMELERPRRQNLTMSDAMKHYMDEDPNGKTPRINYWGYKNGYYFAPKMSYAASDDPSSECKRMVKSLHENGLEIIMQFYFPTEVKKAYILEVIKYWVLEYHVDGFHLMGAKIPTELLATEPMLSNTKLFYYEFPCHEIYGDNIPVYKNLASYNDEFMVALRHFLKSDNGALQTALEYLRKNPGQAGTVNYITNYSGFSLADLVSFDMKHNEENGEENRDGESDNVSWNCGVEGKTRKKSVLSLRLRQMKNAFALLLTAQGTPMIVSGDEFAHSRKGNNNPYCQDNTISWLNWNDRAKNGELYQFVKAAIALRKAHPVLHQQEELTMMDYAACGYPDLSYHGGEAWKLNVDYYSLCAAAMYCGKYARTGRNSEDDFIYIAYNMHWEKHLFALPALPAGMKWEKVMDTAPPDSSCMPETAAAAKGHMTPAEDIDGSGKKPASNGGSADPSGKKLKDGARAAEADGRKQTSVAERSVQILKSVPQEKDPKRITGKKKERKTEQEVKK